MAEAIVKLGERVAAWVETKFAPPMAAFAAQKHMFSIRNGMIQTIPFTIVGSVYLILAAMSDPTVGIAGFVLEALSPYNALLYAAFTMTFGLMSIVAAFSIAYYYAKVAGIDPLINGILALVNFLIISAPVTEGMLPTAFLGTGGIFSAILISIISSEIFYQLMKRGFVIKLPKGVPPAVIGAFMALIPGVITFTASWLISIVMGISVQDILTALIAPIVAGADTIVAFTVNAFITNLLWSVGIHPESITWSVTLAPMTANIAANAEAVLAGVHPRDLPHIWCGFMNERVCIYAAVQWPLHILCLRSKSERIRRIAWMALPANIFLIIEPFQFGLPVAMNPFFIIPYIAWGTFTAFLHYLLQLLRLMNRAYILIPWATPAFILAYVTSGGDLMWMLNLLFNVVVGLPVYYPFFKAFERRSLEEEAALKKGKE